MNCPRLSKNHTCSRHIQRSDVTVTQRSEVTVTQRSEVTIIQRSDVRHGTFSTTVQEDFDVGRGNVSLLV